MSDEQRRYTDDPNPPRRRKRDRWEHLLRENWYRDLWLAAISLVVLAALAVGWQERAEQREGRRIAIEATCAALSAVIEAGKETIEEGGALPARLDSFLQRYGYPPPEERERGQRETANAYVQSIATAIHDATGLTEVISSDGRVDCSKMIDRALER